MHLDRERVFADQAQSDIRASAAPYFLENLPGVRAGPVARPVADQAGIGLDLDDRSRVGGLHGLDGRNLDLVPGRGCQRFVVGQRGADGHCQGGLEKTSSCDVHDDLRAQSVDIPGNSNWTPGSRSVYSGMHLAAV